MRTIRDAIAAEHPIALLGLVSTMLEIATSAGETLGERHPDADTELVHSFADVDRLETTAALRVLAAITGDDQLRAELNAEVARRRPYPLPSWLEHLDAAEATAAIEWVHVQGDGDDIVIALDLPPSQSFTFVAYVDHNLHTLVKDAFALPFDLEGSLAAFHQAAAHDGSPGAEFRPLDLATARARIEGALALAEALPAYESETWPGFRPLLRWVLRLLPAGGTGYVRTTWTDAQEEELVDRFFTSPYAENLPVPEGFARTVVRSAATFGVEHGGDAMRWTPVTVEIIMTTWLPDVLSGGPMLLAQAPDVLQRFVEFCHAERDLPDPLRRETVEAIDLWRPMYDARRKQVLHEDMEQFLVEHWRQRLEILADEVGGQHVLDTLQPISLPDEPFDWSVVAPLDRDVVATVVELADAGCDALLDVEHRTACRRLIALAAAGDPRTVLRRKRDPNRLAAAAVLAVGRLNRSIGAGEPVMVRELTEQFRLKTGVRDLERTILGAAMPARDPSADAPPTSLAVLLTKIGCQRIIGEREDLLTRLIDAEDGIDWDNL